MEMLKTGGVVMAPAGGGGSSDGTFFTVFSLQSFRQPKTPEISYSYFCIKMIGAMT